MIVVVIQSADGQQLVGTLQLAFEIAVFGADARFQGQAAVGPELALAAEAMWDLDQCHQQGGSDPRSERFAESDRHHGEYASGAAPGLLSGITCHGAAEGFRARLQAQGFTGIRLLAALQELDAAEQQVLASWSGPWLTKYPWEKKNGPGSATFSG